MMYSKLPHMLISVLYFLLKDENDPTFRRRAKTAHLKLYSIKEGIVSKNLFMKLIQLVKFLTTRKKFAEILKHFLTKLELPSIIKYSMVRRYVTSLYLPCIW